MVGGKGASLLYLASSLSGFREQPPTLHALDTDRLAVCRTNSYFAPEGRLSKLLEEICHLPTRIPPLLLLLLLLLLVTKDRDGSNGVSLQLEDGDQRAPRLLVFDIFLSSHWLGFSHIHSFQSKHSPAKLAN